MTRLFVAVKFREGDRRTYTYHWDGPAFPLGSTVKVPDKSGEGWNAVIVDSITDQPPKFTTKAIIGAHHPLTEGHSGKRDLLDGVEGASDAKLAADQARI